MNRITWSVVVVLGLSSVQSAQEACAQTTHEILGVGIAWIPADVTIEIGDSVRWGNLFGGFHTVAEVDDASDQSWNGGFHSAPGAFEFTFLFTTPGVYHYICEPHVRSGMRGTVTVGGGPPDETAPTEVNNTGSTVTVGGTDTITNIELRYDDNEQPAANVNYTIDSGPSNGPFELTTNPGAALTSFTQSEIDAGQVVYIHDGSDTTSDSITFTVDDSLGNSLAGESFSITVTSIVEPLGNRYITVPDPLPSAVAAGPPLEVRRVTFVGRCDGGSNEAGTCTDDVDCPGGACRLGGFPGQCDGGEHDGKRCERDVDCDGDPSGDCLLGGFPYPSQSFLYVGPPFQAPDEDIALTLPTFAVAPLQCDPFFHDWSTEGTVSIYGAEIVPDGEYEVERADSSCPDLSEPACWSAVITVRTAKFGDIWPPLDDPANPSQPDFKDISAMVRKFQHTGSACTASANDGTLCEVDADCQGGICAIKAPLKATCQLGPNVVSPLLPINFKDIAATVAAFTGTRYNSDKSGPCTCPSPITCGVRTCANDLECTVCEDHSPCDDVEDCMGIGDESCEPGGFCVGTGPCNVPGNCFCTDSCGRCSP